MTPDLGLVIDELVLDGVEPDDPFVEAAVARALAPALEAHGLESSTGRVASAVTAAVAEEASRH